MISNAHTVGFDNPQARLHTLSGQSPNGPLKTANTGSNGLVSRSEDNDARRLRWIVPAGIREIEVQCDEDAPFDVAREEETLIVRAGQMLLVNILDVPAAGDQRLPRRARHILIQLEAHQNYTGTGTTRSWARAAA